MTLNVETVVLKKLTPSTGVPIDCAIPVFGANEVVVSYGRAGILMVKDTDFTVTLVDPNAVDVFTITPLASMRTKLNALLAADGTEEDAIWVRRVMSFLTDSTPENCLHTSYVSNEITRATARDQEAKEASGRSLKATLSRTTALPQMVGPFAPGAVLTVSPDGLYIEDGEFDTAGLIEAVETATNAAAAADADAAQVATDRAAVAADKATVAADKAIVAADKGIVAADKATVAADKGIVAADKAIVEGYRNEVEADRVEVATNTGLTSGYATSAANSAADAAEALDQVLNYGDFINRYLGDRAADPVTWDEDNPTNPGGTDPLIAGLIYYNTVAGEYRTYSGSVWDSGAGDTSDFVRISLNGSDYDAATFRTNLSLYSKAEIDAYAGNAAAKTTPIDADSLAIVDSAAGNVQKRTTWANIKAAIWAALGPAIFAYTAKSSLVDNDLLAIADSASSNDGKKTSFANVYTWIQVKLNTTSKAAPVVGDRLYIGDSAASNAQKYSTITQLFTLLGTIINAFTAKSTPVGADVIAIADSAASFAPKKTLLSELATWLFTNPTIVGTITDDIYTIVDAAGYVIDPANGSVQRWVLGASRTPGAAHANWTNGKTVTLLIDDGTAFTITWTTLGVVWKGGVAPTLATSGITEISLTKENNVIRGVVIGDFAS